MKQAHPAAARGAGSDAGSGAGAGDALVSGAGCCVAVWRHGH